MKKQLLTTALVSMFCMGALDILRGIATPGMQADWNLSYSQLGTAFSVGSAGYLVGSFLCGFIVERSGLKVAIIGGGVLMAAGIAVLIAFHGYPWFVGGFITMGVGGGIFEIGINGVVPAISNSSRDQSRYFHWLHGFYGVGAAGFPLVAVWILHLTQSWRSGYLVTLILLSFILLYVSLTRYGKLKPAGHRQAGIDISTLELFKSPILYGLLTAIMTYVMAEIGIATWLPTYLMKVRNMTLAQGSFYLSGFYLTFTIGRLTGHQWVHRIGHGRAVILSSLISIIILGVAVFGSKSTLVFFIATGIGFATIFPTIAAVASDIYPSHAGKVLGFLFAASAIGNFFANWLIGHIATAYGLRQGFTIIFVFLIATAISMTMVMWLRRSHPSLNL